MKKQILTLAIITMLPFGVIADNHVGPVGNIGELFDENGNMYLPANTPIATDAVFYAPVEITNDDKQHIASTAYVKGAHNDTIAAINKLGFDVINSFNDLRPTIELPVNTQWGTETTTSFNELQNFL